MQLFVTCPKGMENLLETEVKQLGCDAAKLTLAGVQVDGDLELAYRICLWSRLANRVLLLLGQVDAQDAEQLYEGVSSVNWLEHLRPGDSFTIDFNGQNSAINNTHFGALKVKDAIVDQIRSQTGTRPSVDKQQPDLRINVHLRRDKAQLAIDLSGDSLHKRGYRQFTGEAPMKENLAAALLYRMGINRPGAALTLLDPMCGAGTLLTEAAMILADIAPGLSRRSFGFDRWLMHQPSVWNRLRSEAQSRRDLGKTAFCAHIFGRDADERAIENARLNAERLGVLHLIDLQRSDLSQIRAPKGSDDAVILTNPPYGARLGDQTTLGFLYRELGDLLKREFAGWRAGVFSSNPELFGMMRLAVDKRYTLFNGALESKLCTYRLHPQPESGEPNEPAKTVEALSDAAQMLENRVRKNLKNLDRWVKREGIEAYRVYDADLPEYAFAIDRYGDQLVVQEYAPPAKIDPVKAARRLQDGITVVSRVFELGTHKIWLKQRKRQSGTAQYERQGQAGTTLTVKEHGCLFEVNLQDYLDTGLFLDHRPVRKKIQALSQGKKVLNLFCYTGAASVHAAQGGAKKVTSVDLSATYLDWARRNFQLNGIDVQQHEFIQADCLQWLERPMRERFDLIFLDPPTFSNSKRMTDVLDVQRDHPRLVEGAMRLLSPEGVVIFSNNYRRFKIDEALTEKFEVRDITAQTIDPDFRRNPKIHTCFEIRHR